MRVLFIQNIAGLAGSEKYILALMPSLIKRGIHCEFICVCRKNTPEQERAIEFIQLLEESGVKAHYIKIHHYVSLSLLFKINKIYKQGNFDCFHSHLIYADVWVATIKKFINPKVKIISTKHGYQEKINVGFALNPENAPHNLYYKLFAFSEKMIDQSFSCSYGLREFYIRMGLYKESEMEVIEHGFDYDKIVKVEDDSRRVDSPRLTIVGRLIKRKGHQFVISMLPDLISAYPGLKLLIIGNGEYENELKAMVSKYKLENSVEFLGYQTDVTKYMKTSDLILMPSYTEGLPLTIFEAFNSLCPVVAFNTIGCKDALEHDVTGILVEPFNVNAFKGAILKLLGDPAKRKSLAKNAYAKLIDYYCLDRMTNETITLYQKVLRRT